MADRRGAGRGKRHSNRYNNNNYRNNGDGGHDQNGEQLDARRGFVAYPQQQQYPIAWKHIEELNDKVLAKEILEGSSDLLNQMSLEPVFWRMDEIWMEPYKQEAFLRLSLFTARAKQESIRQRTLDFLHRILGSKLIDTLVKQHFCTPRPHTAIAHSLIGILLLGWQTFPSLMKREMTIHTNKVINKMEMVSKTKQLPKETKDLLGRLKGIMQIEHADPTRANKNVGAAGGQRVYDSNGSPPQDFREIDVSPSRDDILVDNSQVYLRKAIINGQPYDNDEHYLDVQFRLLHEDLIRPLRNGIHREKLDLYVYRDVRLICTKLQKQDGEILTYAQLNQRDSNRRMHRRFMFGSLVCLSSDTFQQQFLFATVVDRDALESSKKGQSEKFQQNLRKGAIGLKFISTMDHSNMNANYFLVESPVFYEGHRHVLLALQNFKSGDAVPFSRYLVQMKQQPLIPRYQRDGRMFDFSSLLVNSPRYRTTHCTTAQLTNYYTTTDFGMDHSQFEAFAYALRSELAIVQGPPGTGKTYLGLKIVQLLLANEQLWAQPKQEQQQPNTNANRTRQQLRSPMLVVCYTNHALDQFLEGIAHFLQDGIVRVGGQSKNAALAKFNLSNLRQDAKKYLTHTQRKAYSECRNELYLMTNEVEKNEKALAQTFNQLEALVILRKEPWARAHFHFERNGPHSINEWLNDAETKLKHEAEEQNEEKKQEEPDEEEEERYVDKVEENRKLAMDESYVDKDDEFLKAGHPKQKERHLKDSLERTEKKIMADPMNEAEAAQFHEWQDDPWQLPQLTRLRLYHRWEQEWREKQAPKELMRKYCEAKRRFDELRSQTDVELLKRVKVIGMTTTGAARLQATLRSVKPRIVVVEEAAEVYEQHILTSLTECCEHLILIGDHQQLRPSPEDYQIGKDYHLEISLFERLVRNQFDFRRLNNQHRMRPEISTTLMPQFYKNLQDHPSVHEYPNVLGMGKNLFFLNHSHPEDVKEGNDSLARSHGNEFEANFAVRLVKYLSQQGYPDSMITILVTYSEQLFLIRNLLMEQKKAKRADAHPNISRIRVENVDNYQGEECDIIILSLVRSNNAEKKIGFLNIPNRVCVAMSRAKRGFYVLGNIDFLAECCTKSRQAPKLWEDIRRSAIDRGFLGHALPIACQMHGNKQEIRCAEDFDKKAKEGGCNEPCKTLMDCGHICRKRCHIYDQKHKEICCMEKCQRKCANELHKSCQKRCHEDCDLCLVKFMRELPCGHSKYAECHLDPQQVVCPWPCQHILPCGHQCANQCNQEHTTKCKVPVRKQLPCEHEAEMECHQSPESVKCTVKVEKIWPICDHSMEAECWMNPEEMPCPHPCQQTLPGCGHPCVGTCGKCRGGRLHVECVMDCKRILLCGHECRTKCALECPPCRQHCETACVHSQCSKVALEGEKRKKLREETNHARKERQGRLCGDLCPPCAESCPNRCRHRHCTKNCGEKCDVEPCNEPCGRELPCSRKSRLKKGECGPLLKRHYCIGVCGEDCIRDICRICQPAKFEEVREICSATENARFIRLKDCGHIFEMNCLDEFVKMQLKGETNEWGDRAIVMIKCPQCSTPIKHTKRYIALLNERASDIEKVKRKLLGYSSKERLVEEWRKFKEILAKLDKQRLAVVGSFFVHNDFMEAMMANWELIMTKLKHVKRSDVTAQWINTSDNIHGILTGFEEALIRIKGCHFLDAIVQMPPMIARQQTLREFLLKDLANLMRSLAERKMRTISTTSLDQLASELGRNKFLLNVFKLAGTVEKEGRTDEDMEREGEMLRALLAKMAVDRRPFVEQWESLKGEFKMVTAHFKMEELDGITNKQRAIIDIKQPLSSNLGKWWKCPNGHVYNIGQCEEATECPDCKEAISSEGQQPLLDTNEEACHAEFLWGFDDLFEAHW